MFSAQFDIHGFCFFGSGFTPTATNIQTHAMRQGSKTCKKHSICQTILCSCCRLSPAFSRCHGCRPHLASQIHIWPLQVCYIARQRTTPHVAQTQTLSAMSIMVFKLVATDLKVVHLSRTAAAVYFDSGFSALLSFSTDVQNFEQSSSSTNTFSASSTMYAGTRGRSFIVNLTFKEFVRPAISGARVAITLPASFLFFCCC